MLTYSLAFSDKREQYTEGLIMQTWHQCSYLRLSSHGPFWPASLAPFTKSMIRNSQESMSIIQSSAASSWASMKELKCGLKDRAEALPNGHSCTEGFGNGSALVAEQTQPFVFQAQSFAKVKAVDSMTGFMNKKGGKAMHEPCEESGSICTWVL